MNRLDWIMAGIFGALVAWLWLVAALLWGMP